MHKLLVICGPTAVGKTDVAIYLAQKYQGDILAADSRQIYKGMDIGTGKDKPDIIGNVGWWGIDLVEPINPFSAADYAVYAHKAIESMWAKNRLPIMTVGTGFYLKSVISPPATLSVPPNETLRYTLEKFDLASLQKVLAEVDTDRWRNMNASDRSNGRRLIRAIEVAQSQKKMVHPIQPLRIHKLKMIGLTAPIEWLEDRIKVRVEKRANEAFTEELWQLLTRFPNFFQYPAASATGYREWQDYLLGKITKKEALTLWKTRECHYARRQLTWFKKIEGITWFDVSQKTWQSAIELKLQSW